MPHRRVVVVILSVLAAAALPAVAQAAEPAPFGHPCRATDGVRFCPTNTLEQRVPSFDGVPIDADVTLPATGEGPWPTVVLLHGYGGSKTSTEAGADGVGVDNVVLAQRGYVVLNTSARGFGRSCGRPESRVGDGCARGWIHLADQRFEVRDTQELLGRLVDEGVADKAALGAAGGSYGGGQSLQLAFLRDRVRLPDGSFAPWRSPAGTALALAAAAPVIPWSDLTNALIPNGSRDDLLTPVGVPISSYVNGLYVAGNAAGWVAPKGADPAADLTTWRDVTNAGEPFGPEVGAIQQELSTFHSAWRLRADTPAPLLLTSGWTDDLFPPVHTLRVYDALRARDPDAPVWLQLGDLGHARGGRHAGDLATLDARTIAFLDHYLRGARMTRLGEPGSAIAFGQRCPRTARHGLGPYRARSFARLVAGARLTLRARGAQTVDSRGGDAKLAKALDPVAGEGGDACATYAAGVDDGTAVASARLRRDRTLLGIGRVTARVRTQGAYPQLAARLWDVHDGRQTLVDRSVLRLRADQAGRVDFDLHGNGYRFRRGHTARLELVGADAPTHRASDDPFTVRVSELRVRLPVR